MSRLVLSFVLLGTFVLPLMPVSVQAEVIFKQRSLYRNIEVVDDRDSRCLRFANRERRVSRQSCQYFDDPDRLVFDYGKLVFTGFLMNPNPERILIIGLGGGSLPRLMQKLFPESRIDSVEIDPAVIQVAEKYFSFTPREQDSVVARDGRVFVRRALLSKQTYDFILLDAFTGDYIPEHMMTREYLQECKELLAEGGVLVANTFSSSRLYRHETATFAAAFDWFFNMRRQTGNRVIITGKMPQPDLETLRDKARRIDWREYGIDLEENLDWIEAPSKRDLEARVLTDEYSPANLLNGPG
ncbi:MAG: fused MFS/spermidine synthase [Gammaproteobacteria bacterium]|nr:fused MFS/spermidine synthase [Gammaproteobacteria bacterium]